MIYFSINYTQKSHIIIEIVFQLNYKKCIQWENYFWNIFRKKNLFNQSFDLQISGKIQIWFSAVICLKMWLNSYLKFQLRLEINIENTRLIWENQQEKLYLGVIWPVVNFAKYFQWGEKNQIFIAIYGLINEFMTWFPNACIKRSGVQRILFFIPTSDPSKEDWISILK